MTFFLKNLKNPFVGYINLFFIVVKLWKFSQKKTNDQKTLDLDLYNLNLNLFKS